MAFLIPEAAVGVEGLFGAGEVAEAGGAAEEGAAAEEGTAAESAVPKMEKAAKPAEAESSSLSMKDLFLYNSLQQKPQPVVINNQNNIGQPVAAIPVIEPPTAPPSPVESKNEKDNDIVSKANNNIIKIEENQLSTEKDEIVKIQEQEPRTKTSMEKLQELMDLYNKNLYMFKKQQERMERFY